MPLGYGKGTPHYHNNLPSLVRQHSQVQDQVQEQVQDQVQDQEDVGVMLL